MHKKQDLINYEQKKTKEFWEVKVIKRSFYGLKSVLWLFGCACLVKKKQKNYLSETVGKF